MQRFSALHYAIIVSLLVFVAGLLHALMQHPPYAPQFQADHRSERGLHDANDGSSESKDRPRKASSGSSISAKIGQNEHKPEAEKHGEEGTEFWPPFYGYRLKITDTLIAGFTALLFWATWLLWRATKRLVTGADDTARRQLRAYISANPAELSSAEREERFVRITFALKNHGQTPAREIHHIFDFDVFPNPLPAGFSYPIPTTPIHMEATLFPQGEMTVWLNFNRLISTDEFGLVEQDRLRLHIWGKTFYRTTFDQSCQTNFRASVGGAAFIANLRAMRRNTKGPPFNWTWEAGHGSGD